MTQETKSKKIRKGRKGWKRKLPARRLLVDFAARNEIELREIFETCEEERYLPPAAFVARFADHLEELFRSVIIRAAEHPDAKGRSVTNSWVERRFYIVGDIVDLPSASPRDVKYGRYDAEAEILKVWKHDIYPRPRKAGDGGGRGTKVKALAAGVERGVSAANRIDLEHVAAVTRSLHERFDRYGWLVLDVCRRTLKFSKERTEAKKLWCVSAFDWRPAMIAFNRAVAWRFAVHKGQAGRRPFLVLTDGDRWAAGFASPPRQEAPAFRPPKDERRRPRVMAASKSGSRPVKSK